MNGKIWIINHYAGDMIFDKGGRHYWFAKYLQQEGYNSVIFAANSKHNIAEKLIDSKELWIERLADEINTPFVYVKSKLYSGNGINRVLNMISFYMNVKKVALQYAKRNGKPGVIIASSVHPLTLVAGIKLAKKFGVKCICEVRDLWPESVVEYGIASKNNPIVFLLRFMEKWIYKKADSLIFLGAGDYQSIVDQGWEEYVPKEKFVYINNGVDLGVFDYNKEHFIIQDMDLEDCSFYNVIYTGSVRKVNDLSGILEVAKLVKNPKIKFLIWGNGDQLESLKKRVFEEKIENVIFKGWIEKKYIPYITSKAYINYSHNQPSPLFKYGISFNKIFDYLAAGRPILCDFPCPYNPVTMGNAGVSVDSADPVDIAKQIEEFVEMDKNSINEYCENARKTAAEYDFKVLTRKLLEVVNGL